MERDFKSVIRETPAIFLSDRREHHIFQTHASFKAMNNLMKSIGEGFSSSSTTSSSSNSRPLVAAAAAVEKNEKVGVWPKAVFKEKNLLHYCLIATLSAPTR